jgi:phospholipid-binding lipoprotein MlaA
MRRAFVFLFLLLLTLHPLHAEDEVDHLSRSSTDPWEGVNRKTFRFNRGVDRVFFNRLSSHSDGLIPKPVTLGVRNFFSNLNDINIAVNNLLQGKFKHALSDGGRFVVNTTMGLGGLFDVATLMKLEKHYEDFGQTFGKWGVPSGPYLVIPLFGPSSVRDAAGLVGDYALDPVLYVPETKVVVGLFILRAVNMRNDLQSITDIIDQAALDPYAFERDSWLQKREFDIRDGSFEDEDF